MPGYRPISGDQKRWTGKGAGSENVFLQNTKKKS